MDNLGFEMFNTGAETDDKDAKQSKQMLAYRYLHTAIITGKLPPEKPLVERDICEKLGISRTPVREALRRLGSEGLVDFIPNRGVFVTAVTKERTTQLYELKEALECMAAKLCAERATQEDIKRLEENLEQQRRSSESGNLDISVETDLQFHVLLVEIARSPMLEQQAKSLLMQTRRLSQLAVYDAEQAMNFVAQHSAILEGIRNRDSAAAAKAVSEHIRFIQQFQFRRWSMLF